MNIGLLKGFSVAKPILTVHKIRLPLVKMGGVQIFSWSRPHHSASAILHIQQTLTVEGSDTATNILFANTFLDSKHLLCSVCVVDKPFFTVSSATLAYAHGFLHF